MPPILLIFSILPLLYSSVGAEKCEKNPYEFDCGNLIYDIDEVHQMCETAEDILCVLVFTKTANGYWTYNKSAILFTKPVTTNDTDAADLTDATTPYTDTEATATMATTAETDSTATTDATSPTDASDETDAMDATAIDSSKIDKVCTFSLSEDFMEDEGRSVFVISPSSVAMQEIGDSFLNSSCGEVFIQCGNRPYHENDLTDAICARTVTKTNIDPRTTYDLSERWTVSDHQIVLLNETDDCTEIQDQYTVPCHHHDDCKDLRSTFEACRSDKTIECNNTVYVISPDDNPPNMVPSCLVILDPQQDMFSVEFEPTLVSTDPESVICESDGNTLRVHCYANCSDLTDLIESACADYLFTCGDSYHIVDPKDQGNQTRCRFTFAGENDDGEASIVELNANAPLCVHSDNESTIVDCTSDCEEMSLETALDICGISEDSTNGTTSTPYDDGKDVNAAATVALLAGDDATTRDHIRVFGPIIATLLSLSIIAISFIALRSASNYKKKLEEEFFSEFGRAPLQNDTTAKTAAKNPQQKQQPAKGKKAGGGPHQSKKHMPNQRRKRH